VKSPGSENASGGNSNAISKTRDTWYPLVEDLSSPTVLAMERLKMKGGISLSPGQQKASTPDHQLGDFNSLYAGIRKRKADGPAIRTWPSKSRRIEVCATWALLYKLNFSLEVF